MASDNIDCVDRIVVVRIYLQSKLNVMQNKHYMNSKYICVRYLWQSKHYTLSFSYRCWCAEFRICKSHHALLSTRSQCWELIGWHQWQSTPQWIANFAVLRCIAMSWMLGMDWVAVNWYLSTWQESDPMQCNRYTMQCNAVQSMEHHTRQYYRLVWSYTLTWVFVIKRSHVQTLATRGGVTNLFSISYYWQE